LAFEAGLAVFKETLADKIYGAETYEKAFAAGLPEDDELAARNQCAGLYHEIVTMKGDAEGLSTHARTLLPEYEKSLRHMERSMEIDRAGDYKYYATRLGRACLAQYDRLVSVAGSRIKEANGRAAAITYLENKVKVAEYLPSTPMLASLLELGISYPESEDEKALKCFRAIVEAEPVLPDGDPLEPEIRRLAQNNIQVVFENRNQPQPKSGCFIASAVYDGENAPEIVILRRFRDTRLVPHPVGRALISVYYFLSPPLAGISRRFRIVGWLIRSVVLDPFVHFVNGRVSSNDQLSEPSSERRRYE
jgi:hypothetical protein